MSIVSDHSDGGYGMGPGQGMGPGAVKMGHGHGHGMVPGAGMGPGMGGMHGFDSSAVAAARLGALKAALKITPEQEPAWATYETQVRQQIETRQVFPAAMQAQMQDPKAMIDHDARHEAMGKLLAARAEARDAMYAVLTPEQKALLDRSRGQGHGPHMGW